MEIINIFIDPVLIVFYKDFLFYFFAILMLTVIFDFLQFKIIKGKILKKLDKEKVKRFFFAFFLFFSSILMYIFFLMLEHKMEGYVSMCKDSIVLKYRNDQDKINQQNNGGLINNSKTTEVLKKNYINNKTPDVYFQVIFIILGATFYAFIKLIIFFFRSNLIIPNILMLFTSFLFFSIKFLLYLFYINFHFINELRSSLVFVIEGGYQIIFTFFEFYFILFILYFILFVIPNFNNSYIILQKALRGKL